MEFSCVSARLARAGGGSPRTTAPCFASSPRNRATGLPRQMLSLCRTCMIEFGALASSHPGTLVPEACDSDLAICSRRRQRQPSSPTLHSSDRRRHARAHRRECAGPSVPCASGARTKSFWAPGCTSS
ncbi:hypothetical protein PsYK624_110060 [Phanerochaete sordida]|uniref:Uncharacterized protein n=1 Tax=Phanerochaete sordida TaxID=48140 RepID=A0A9P3GHE0_9APHY|nr:hypothetical protein PsYK624_110060 [Phanerochaete sordida]